MSEEPVSVGQPQRVLAGWRIRNLWPLVPALVFVVVALALWMSAERDVHAATRAAATRQASARATVHRVELRLASARRRAVSVRRNIRREQRTLTGERRWYSAQRSKYVERTRLQGSRTGASAGRAAAISDVNGLERNAWYFVHIAHHDRVPSVIDSTQLTGDPATTYWKVP